MTRHSNNQTKLISEIQADQLVRDLFDAIVAAADDGTLLTGRNVDDESIVIGICKNTNQFIHKLWYFSRQIIPWCAVT